MKVLFGGVGHPAFVNMSGKFNEELAKLGIDLMEVNVREVGAGFPETRPREWLFDTGKFRKFVDEFEPDFVATDHQGYFGLAAIKEGIPLLTYLRGNYWREMEWITSQIPAKKLFDRLAWWWRMKYGNECFQRSSIIVSVSRHLDDIVRARFPKHPTAVMHQGIDPDAWRSKTEDEGMDFNHPCVGFVQNANIYEKTVGMLVLSKVMKALPEVTFYWAGDGPYRDTVLSELSKHDNFEWLGNLNACGVKKFLSSVDIYGLASGLDTLATTVLEAEMMCRPVIATRVGGVPETIVEGKTGLLVDKGDHSRWVAHIEMLLRNEKVRRKMGGEGKRFVEENFTPKTMALQFSDAIGKMA